MKTLKLTIGLIFLLVSNIIFAENYRISVITCSDGDQVYSAFGHTALRVVNTNQNTDLVYNYGTFDMSEPNFLNKFVSGELRYFVSVYPFYQFVNEYTKEKRSVFEQVLHLDSIQVSKILSRLQFDTKSENIFYKYNFISNNCTTKIFELFAGIQNKNDLLILDNKTTFRKKLDYTLHNTYVKLSYNILMGADADTILAGKQSFGLPENFSIYIDNYINNTKNKILLFETQVIESKIKIYHILIFILLIEILLLFINNKLFVATNKCICSLSLLISSIFGMLITVLWINDFTLAKNNINILWALPLNILLAPLLFFNSIKIKLILKKAIILNIFLLILFLIISLFPFQSINFSIYTIVFFLGFNYYYIFAK